jgi:PAS domain S-box-containing protein
MNNLLKRQLRKCFGDNIPTQKEWQIFLQTVDAAYGEFDSDRAMLERTLELSSQEHLQAAAHMEKVRQIALGIESRSTLSDMLTFVVESARDLPGINFVVVEKLDDEKKFLLTPYFSKIRDRGEVKLLSGIGFNVEDYFGKLSTSGKLQFEVDKMSVAKDYQLNPRALIFDRMSDLLDGVWPKLMCDSIQKILGVKKQVVTPLLIDGQLWGSLLFLLDDHVTLNILETITAHCALGIKNVQMLESLQNRNLELAAINRIAGKLTSSLDIGKLLENTLGETIRAFDADAAAVYLRGKDGNTLELIAHIGMPPVMTRMANSMNVESGPMGKFFSSENDVVFGNFLEYARQFPHYPKVFDTSVPCYFASVVLPGQEQREGIMTIVRIGKQHFDDADKALLLTIAGQLSLAIENARLHTDVLIKMKEVDAANLQLAKTLEKLTASEEKYRNVVELAKDGICIIQNKVVTYCNPQLAQMWSGTVDEIEGTPFSDYVHPEAAAEVLDRYARRIAGEPTPAKYETALKRRDGTKLNVEFNVGMLDYLGKETEIAIIHDITERKQAEEALKESETRYRELVNTITSGVIIYKPVDNGQDFVFVDINSAAEKLDKVNRNDVIGKRITGVVPGSRKYDFFKAFQRVWQTGKPESFPSGIPKDKNAPFAWRENYAYKLPSGEIVNIYNDITKRKQAELALQASEQNFRNSLESSLIGIHIVDNNWNTLYANRAFLDIYGYGNIAEVKSDPPHRHYTPQSFADYVIRNERINKGEPAPERIEADIVRKDGTIRHITASRKDVLWDGKQQYQIIFNDITEQKKFEDALRESEEKYRTIFESVNDIIILLDTHGTIIDVNSRLTDIGGYDRRELIGKNAGELTAIIKGENLSVVLGKLSQIVATNKVITYQVEMVKKNQETILIEITGVAIRKSDKIVGVLAILRDITERNRAEKQFREQKALTDRVLESTPDAVAVVGQDRRVIMANKAFEYAFELEEGKAVGKEVREIIPISGVIDTITEVLSSGKSRLQVEFRIKRNSLEKTLVADVIFTQKNEALAMFHDITEERALQERLYLTDRLASVGEMAAGIAHELNNPLTGVVALSQLLLENGVPADMQADMEAISSEGRRAAGVVKNLLAFARSHTLSAESTDLNAVINEVLSLRAYEHKVSNIEVCTSLSPAVPSIITDRFQMQQVFLNIVLNAEQAMIEAHSRGCLTIKSERTDNHIRVSFANDGPEIPPDIINRIFDPFFTTKEVGKGTGLGLSICYGIVTNQGGRIYAQNQSGNGPEFVVELPVNNR